jgi:flagellar basal body P-ring formation protein FlgA
MFARGGLLLILAMALPAPAQGEVLLAARTLRAGVAIQAHDLAMGTTPAPPGAATMPDEVIGMEPRVTLYAGRPIPVSALAPPAVIERNQIVTLRFSRAGLEIHAEGRALARGAEGEVLRVMNLASRSIVTGQVAGPGLVIVHP